MILVDPKHERTSKDGFLTLGMTVQDFLYDLRWGGLRDMTGSVRGILMAPPCTHFSVSGAQYWKTKDEDGRTAEAIDIVDACLTVVADLKPDWWCLENPVGRLPRLYPMRLGRPLMYFHPCEYAGYADDPEGEAYTKKTGLWGFFNTMLTKDERTPVRVCSQGSWIQRLGGASYRTKELRSITPTGFARAFARANP